MARCHADRGVLLCLLEHHRDTSRECRAHILAGLTRWLRQVTSPLQHISGPQSALQLALHMDVGRARAEMC